MTLSRPAKTIILLTILGGALSLGLFAPDVSAFGHMTRDQWYELITIGALIVGSYLWPLVLYREQQSVAYALDEGFFVVLALLLPPVATLGTFAVASLISQIVWRRPLLKAGFNIGQYLVAVGVAVTVTRSLGAPHQSFTPADLGMALVGAGVFFVINDGLLAAIMVATGAKWPDCVLDDLSIRAGLLGAGVLVGEVLAVGVAAHTWLLILAVPMLVMLRVVLTGQFVAQHDRERMQGLFDVTLRANRQLRSEHILETILTSARELLRCSEADVVAVKPAEDELSARIEVDGDIRWLVVSGRARQEPFDNADKVLLEALAATARGALANAELYRQVRFERERLASITLSIGEGVCAVDTHGMLTFVNPAAAELIHLPSLSVPIGDSVSKEALRAPEFLANVAAAVMEIGREISEDDVRFPARKGGTVPVSYTAAPVLDAGVPVGAVITFQDITERKAHEDEMFHHAYHDSLTGLGNRRLLVEHLGRALEESKIDGRTHALIFVDIDRFKAINDSLGHVTGDDLLVAIAARIKATTRTGDLLARFGGDEFIVLLEDVTGVEEAVAAAERICAAVEKPMILADGYEIVASLSVGITLTEDDKSIDDILRDADVAMYEAKVKGGGGGYKVFDLAAMGSRSPDRVALEADLRRSLERDELDVYFQPFFSVADHQIVGCEALVRWNHPTQGLLDPGRFIGLAEETGLILPIGQFVLERSCEQAREIRDRLGLDLPMSVNLSARQFRQNSLVNDVAGALERAGLDPSTLILEITETMVMDDIAGAREVMKRLNKLGVRLAIDDFGTGHSSLSYLKQFPVHEVKVDRQFVSGVSEHPVDTAIVRAVVELAGAMNMVAVAEGVETVEQLNGLRKLGCEVAQGYYFSRPLPAEDFVSLLDRQFGPPTPIIQLRPRRLVS